MTGILGIFSWAFKLIAPNVADIGIAYVKKKLRLIDNKTYKQIRANQTKIEVERFNIEIAKLKAQTAEIKQQAKIDIANVNADYLHDRDIRRLNKRRYSDDILRIGLALIFLCAFIPITQPYVISGFTVLASVPVWMIPVLLIASLQLLGGHALLRMLIGFKRGGNADKR